MGLTPERFSREEAHRHLDAWLDAAQGFKASDDPNRDYSDAYFHLSMFLADLGRMLPLDFLRAAYGPDDMLAASSRMGFITWLFLDVEDQDATYSANTLRHEMEMIAYGDAPKTFAQREKRSGKRTNAYELARAEAQAFYWDALLESLGISAVERQMDIGKAFLKPWDSLRKNKPATSGYLGEDTFREIVERGGLIGDLCRQNGETAYSEALEADGRTFRELHRSRS